MPLISFSNVYRSYQTQIVLDGVSFSIERGDKIGLVGRNGSGKSTVLRIITGKEQPERGTAIIQPRLRIGQVAQDPDLDDSHVVSEAVLQAKPELVQMERDLRRLEQLVGSPSDEGEKALQEYGDIQHEFDRLGGYEFHARASAVLCGLGLPVEVHDRPVSVLSGGQKTRLALAQLLLSDAEVMLLDEPTNHLDVQATEWLEDYLQRSQATILVVSHDRYLLDAVCDHILEIEDSHIESYPGNYTAYLRLKAERLEREKELFERQQQKVQKLEAFIRRYKAGDRSTQARSREKALARMDILDRPGKQKSARINMGPAARSGRDVVRAVQVGKSFGDTPLFKSANLVIERGDRVGLVGPNGAGKTTLIRMIMGQEPITEGALTVGSNVHIGYFSQDFSTLSENRTVLDEIVGSTHLDTPAARSMLGRFLFTDDEVFKNISDLSGGERNRVALCKLLLSRPNVLILDEPTNHLDIATRQGLIDALGDFQGTILVASHDRHLLDRVAGRIIEVADGRVSEHLGNYTDYRRDRFPNDTPSAAPAPSRNGHDASQPGPHGDHRARLKAAGAAGGRQEPAGKSQHRPANLAKPPDTPRQKALTMPRAEKQIQELEHRLSDLTGRMNDPDLYKSPDMLSVVDEYDRVRVRLEHLYEQWAALSE
jgi:ATP-binding cassette subfamily F protein 3